MEQQNSGIVGSNARRGIRGKWLIIGAAVLLSVIATASYVYVTTRQSDDEGPIVRSNVCTNDVTKVAAQYMAGPSDSNEYTKFVEDVKSKPKFDSDPNCLYIVLSYNLAKNISNDNDRYMSRFEKLYDPGKGLSGEFNTAVDPGVLRDRVSRLKSLNELHESENQRINDAERDTMYYAENLDAPQ